METFVPEAVAAPEESEPIQFDGVAEVLGVSNEFDEAHNDLDDVEDRLVQIRERQFALREPIWSTPTVRAAPLVVDASDGDSTKSSDIDLSVDADFTTFNDDFDRRIDELLELTGGGAVENSLDLH